MDRRLWYSERALWQADCTALSAHQQKPRRFGESLRETGGTMLGERAVFIPL